MASGSTQESAFVELKLSGKLPSPSGVGMEILRVTVGDDCSSDEIARTIQIDPALTGRILKLANAAQRASVEGVTTVSEATVRLGLSTVRNVALGFTLIGGNRQGTCQAFDYDTFWSASVLRAVTSQHLAQMLGGCVPAEAFLCGLLAEIGRLAFASVHPQRYDQVLASTTDGLPEELAAAERAAFHIGQGEVAAEMMAEWGLPPLFQAAIAECEAFDETDSCQSGEPLYRMQLLLFAASGLARAALTREASPARLWEQRVHELERGRILLGLDEAGFASLYDKLIVDWKQWCHSLGVATPGAVPLDRMPALARRTDAAEAEEPRPARTVPSDLQLDELRLLVVVDDPRTLAIATESAAGGNWAIRSCRPHEDAQRQILDWSPHVVMAAEHSHGIELCAVLRRCEHGQQSHFFLMTRGEDIDELVRALEAGVDEHVWLPLHPRLLRARLRSTERVMRLRMSLALERDTVRQQVAELGVLTRRLRAASLTDTLTEMPNRRFMMKRLEQDWDASSRSGKPLSVISIDIDHFKLVNDTYGHDVGDAVLREVARVLRRSARKGEQPARMGGEEFMIALRDADESNSRLAAERIRAAVHAEHIEVGGFSSNVTVSIGVATRNAGLANLDALLKAADQALYRAKDAGRNRVCLFGKTDPGNREAS